MSELNNPEYTEHLCGIHCMCSLCLVVPQLQTKFSSLSKTQNNLNIKTNCLQKFLQYCHNGCIVPMTQTLVLKNTKMYYFTRNKIKLSYIRINNVIKVLQNSKNSNNIIVYYENSDKIIYKYELDRLEPSYKYIQSFIDQPTITIHYEFNVHTYRQSKKIQDNLQLDEEICQRVSVNANKLNQYVQSSKQYTTKYSGIMIMSEQFYEQEEVYHQYIFNKYGSQVLCKYLIKLQIQFIKIKTGEAVINADFQWVCFGDAKERVLNTPRNAYRSNYQVRLINVSNLVTKKYRSFQQEYLESIFKKINGLPQYLINLSEKKSKPRLSIFEKSQKIINPEIQTNKIFNKRLLKFRTVIQELYQKQKDYSLSKIRKQRYRSTKTQSEQKEQQLLEKQLISSLSKRNQRQTFRKRFKTEVSETKLKHRIEPPQRKQKNLQQFLTKQQITIKFKKFLHFQKDPKKNLDFYDYII